MNNYEIKLIKKADKALNSYDITQYEHLMINNFIESEYYKKNKEGFISYISDLFFNKISLTLNEYQRLFNLA